MAAPRGGLFGEAIPRQLRGRDRLHAGVIGHVEACGDEALHEPDRRQVHRDLQHAERERAAGVDDAPAGAVPARTGLAVAAAVEAPGVLRPAQAPDPHAHTAAAGSAQL
jgi:hypothetical protein